MNITKILFNKSLLYFALFFMFALWAFWPTYYSNPFHVIQTNIHVHAILMTCWCLMLIAQATLIKFKKYAIHRILGKLSYVLVPLILVSGINIAHFSQSHNTFLPRENYYSAFGHTYISLLAFAILYGLAIWFRKDSSTHARYMICTLFPAFTPVFSRLIDNNFDFILPVLPKLNGIPLVQLIGFGLADILLLTLCILDWRKRKKWNGFPIAFLVILCYHLSDFTLYHFAAWRRFADWIMSLPLS